MAEVYNLLAANADQRAKPAEALSHVAKGLELAERAGALSATARLLNGRGVVLLWQARNDDAAEAMREAERRARLAGFDRVIATSSGNRVVVHQRQGLYGQSMEAAVRSYRVKTRLGDTVGQLHSLNNLGTLYLWLGDVVTARGLFRRLLDRSKAMSHDVNAQIAMSNLAWTAAEAGLPRQTLALLDQSAREFPGTVSRRSQDEIRLVRGMALDRLGRLQEALAHYELALKGMVEARDFYKQAWVHVERGRTMAELGEEDLRRGIALAGRSDLREFEWTGRALLGMLLHNRGKTDEGDRELRRAAEVLAVVLDDLPPRHRARYRSGRWRAPLVEAIEKVEPVKHARDSSWDPVGAGLETMTATPTAATLSSGATRESGDEES